MTASHYANHGNAEFWNDFDARMLAHYRAGIAWGLTPVQAAAETTEEFGEDAEWCINNGATK